MRFYRFCMADVSNLFLRSSEKSALNNYLHTFVLGWFYVEWTSYYMASTDSLGYIVIHSLLGIIRPK